MKPMEFAGRRVLVTGASSGLGREIARHLALEHGAHLVVVARREARLTELARELAPHGTNVQCIVADLASDADVERVHAEAIAKGPIYGVVLNAGTTHFGEDGDLGWPAFRQMLDINVTSVVRLTTLFAPYLEAQAAAGGILLVASLAGLQPVPYQAAYAGTKAFVANYGRSLWHEYRNRNVSISTFAPGGIRTELMETSGLGQHFDSDLVMMRADKCAALAIECFRRRRYMYIPGALNRLAVLAARIIPERLFTARVAAEYRIALRAKNGVE